MACFCFPHQQTKGMEGFWKTRVLLHCCQQLLQKSRVFFFFASVEIRLKPGFCTPFFSWRTSEQEFWSINLDWENWDSKGTPPPKYRFPQQKLTGLTIRDYETNHCPYSQLLGSWRPRWHWGGPLRFPWKSPATGSSSTSPSSTGGCSIGGTNDVGRATCKKSWESTSRWLGFFLVWTDVFSLPRILLCKVQDSCQRWLFKPCGKWVLLHCQKLKNSQKVTQHLWS